MQGLYTIYIKRERKEKEKDRQTDRQTEIQADRDTLMEAMQWF